MTSLRHGGQLCYNRGTCVRGVQPPYDMRQDGQSWLQYLRSRCGLERMRNQAHMFSSRESRGWLSRADPDPFTMPVAALRKVRALRRVDSSMHAGGAAARVAAAADGRGRERC